MDIWRTYNDLDEDYRPLKDPGLPAVRPKYPRRYRAFLYACGLYASMVDTTRAVPKGR